ncbi:MAG: NAD(P)H-dependent oxidoreductase subunit E, partial [Ilumatobacteraceae bacterium]
MSRLNDANVALAKEIIARYPKPKSALIPLLHLSQEQNGYITREAMAHLGELVGVPSAAVYG